MGLNAKPDFWKSGSTSAAVKGINLLLSCSFRRPSSPKNGSGSRCSSLYAYITAAQFTRALSRDKLSSSAFSFAWVWTETSNTCYSLQSLFFVALYRIPHIGDSLRRHLVAWRGSELVVPIDKFITAYHGSRDAKAVGEIGPACRSDLPSLQVRKLTEGFASEWGILLFCPGGKPGKLVSET
jgi:hypothetical protein